MKTTRTNSLLAMPRRARSILYQQQPLSLVILIVLCLGSLNATARDIKSITITSTGLSNETSITNVCAGFKPTLSQIRTYFSKAYPVDGYWSVHTYYSPCYAKGAIEFSDGNRGKWVLRSSGIGGIDWEMSGGVDLFYETNPWYDPFEGSYGENAGV